MRLVLGLLVTLSACTAYEYEEEVFLRLDGSGRFRVSGSREALGTLLPLSRVTVETVRDHFDEPQVELDSVRETERERPLVHSRSSAVFGLEPALRASGVFRAQLQPGHRT